MGKFFLEDMEFFAYHGCFEEEKIIGNTFIVNLEITLNTEEAEKTDKLQNAVNYQEIYSLVDSVMKESCDLLEHLAKKIITAIYEKFNTIEKIRVKVSKLNPPVGGKVKNVSVEIEK